jgi:hypothetical protein
MESAHTDRILEHFNDEARLKNILSAPAVEVVLTKVVEGGVAGYYE